MENLAGIFLVIEAIILGMVWIFGWNEDSLSTKEQLIIILYSTICLLLLLSGAYLLGWY